jgi:predicted MFS family arabinose efflux permease
VLNLIAGGFFIKLVNASFFLLFNLFLAKEGYADPAIANMVSFRFLGMLAIALPMGFLIKSRPLKPLFYLAGITVPLSTLVVVAGVYQGWDVTVYGSLLVGGMGLSSFDIAMLPFILRNEAVENHSSAIALNFSTFSLSIFIAGSLNFLLPLLDEGLFTEGTLVALFALSGLASLFFIDRVQQQPEAVPPKTHNRLNLRQYDWGLITKALVPKILLATGAGLTIQFINLFFYQVFGINFHEFSLMAMLMAILVVMGVLLIPGIKRKLGYSRSISFTQFSAALALCFLATTQYFSFLDVALYIAIACFIVRQPLMNMANPITSELTMYYVGSRNQELVSALNASIWAGSRFFSSQIFGWMRSYDLKFATIFFTTAVLYALATSWYLLLIRDYNARKQSGFNTIGS